jgi:hypothetical protein
VLYTTKIMTNKNAIWLYLEIAIEKPIYTAKDAWYWHVTWRDESHITRRVMSMNVDGHPRKGRPKKRWMDCVKDDMRIKGVNMEITSDRKEWK